MTTGGVGPAGFGPETAGATGPGRDTLADLRSGKIRGERAQMEAAASLMEASFYQELFKALRDTVPSEEGIVSGGQGEEIFSSLMDQHLAEASAARTRGGIGDALYRRFTASLDAGAHAGATGEVGEP